METFKKNEEIFKKNKFVKIFLLHLSKNNCYLYYLYFLVVKDLE